MAKKILFVDDDKALLNTMERNLAFEFEVVTADGCEAALAEVEKQGPFSVAVVDMQMPQVNGIQTIEKLRERMPEAVFMMLTGNQDVGTAVQAINDGHVFRFITKPCEVNEIKRALTAAQEQHNLVIAEKELLYGTFMGSINLMTDIIEMDGNRQIDTRRMAATIASLYASLDLQLGWEEKIASRICLVGIAMLEPQEVIEFESLDPESDEHKNLVNRVFNLSSKMIAKIPRLGWISEVFLYTPKIESYNLKTQRREVVAVCLKVAFYWNYLTLRGLSVEEATSTLRTIMPNMNTAVLEGIGCLDDNRDAHALIKVGVQNLIEGMVPNVDIDSPTGERVISRGRRMSATIIENLQRIPEFANEKIQVIANSCPQFTGA